MCSSKILLSAVNNMTARVKAEVGSRAEGTAGSLSRGSLKERTSCAGPRLSLIALTLGLTILSVFAPRPAYSNRSFEYKDVVEEARLLAQAAFAEPGTVPKFLLEINYDRWRSIRFKPENAIWRADKLPFEVQLFHLGWLYGQKVSIYIVGQGGVEPLEFSPDLFHYGMNEFKDQIPKDLGFAGFRLHYPINSSKYYDEVIVFLGASYFRALGSKQHFGLSSRGVAIDTASDSGEEFPHFRKFWLVRPYEKATAIAVFALLDSPSLTGAYRFDIHPGKSTAIDVSATLFFRKDVRKLGIAPLNSMFFYGENVSIRPVNDFRPEIHDSDGLQIATATGERIWRPLINPKRLLVTSFQLTHPKGIGLFQRDRDFDHYQDLEANYQMRPSTWVTPKEEWGEGRVELVQIPTDSEKNDNIVSYWVPSKNPKAGSSLFFSYQMIWDSPVTTEPALARVIATRTALTEDKKGKLYLIDYEGGKLNSLPEDAKLEAEIAVGGGDVTEQYIQRKNPVEGWRLVFKVKKKEGRLDLVTAGNGKPLELRAYLRRGDEILTETWSYVDPL